MHEVSKDADGSHLTKFICVFKHFIASEEKFLSYSFAAFLEELRKNPYVHADTHKAETC